MIVFEGHVLQDEQYLLSASYFLFSIDEYSVRDVDAQIFAGICILFLFVGWRRFANSDYREHDAAWNQNGEYCCEDGKESGQFDDFGEYATDVKQ